VWGFCDPARRLAEQGRPHERAFLTSSRYEYLFWEMAERLETWPV
jgi:thiaminase